MSVACSFCGVSNAALSMVRMPCCLTFVHAFCHDLQLDQIRQSLGEVPECINCREPLTRATVAEIRKQSRHTVVCAICCEDYVCDDSFTDCDHYFHGLCLKRWIDGGHSQCPVCRKEMGDLGYARLADYMCRARKQTFSNFLESDQFRTFPGPMQTLFRQSIPGDGSSVPELELTEGEVLRELYEMLSPRLSIAQRVRFRNLISVTV